ncbi:rCG22594, partial [Rattus norvegicus]
MGCPGGNASCGPALQVSLVVDGIERCWAEVAFGGA